MTKMTLMVVSVAVLTAGCSFRRVSNTHRLAIRKGNAGVCVEPVGPATKLNDTTGGLSVTLPDTTTATLNLSNDQELGKIYDLGPTIQFAQYAAFSACLATRNGWYSDKPKKDLTEEEQKKLGVTYAAAISDIFDETASLIRAQLQAGALGAAFTAARQDEVQATAAVEKAKNTLEEAKKAASGAKATAEAKEAAKTAASELEAAEQDLKNKTEARQELQKAISEDAKD